MIDSYKNNLQSLVPTIVLIMLLLLTAAIIKLILQVCACWIFEDHIMRPAAYSLFREVTIVVVSMVIVESIK